ncbi:MAG: HigA family addiction module antidote protein [Proteobacteria bacterium]|nr:HigA family addiction module antidote protein [Pseudomonadota bacterium]
MTTRTIPPIHPGVTLREDFMEPHGLSANRLGALVGVPPNRISDIVRGRRSVTADTALRLSRAFGTSPEFWLNLQTHFDLELALAAADDIHIIKAVGE